MIINPYSFAAAGGSFDPLSLSPLLWLDATVATSLYDATSGGTQIADDTTGVARWEDQSGNGNHALQSEATYRPKRKTNALNSKFGMTFDGSNDRIIVPTGNHLRNVAGATMFTVAKRTGGTTYGTVVDVFKTGSELTRAGVFLLASTVSSGGRRLDGDGWQEKAVSATTSTALITSAVFDYTAAELYTGVNGLLTARGGYQSSGNTSDTSSYGIGVGGPKGEQLGGDIMEILIYPTKLSSGNIQAVENYLGGKWGITVS